MHFLLKLIWNLLFVLFEVNKISATKIQKIISEIIEIIN